MHMHVLQQLHALTVLAQVTGKPSYDSLASQCRNKCASFVRYTSTARESYFPELLPLAVDLGLYPIRYSKLHCAYYVTTVRSSYRDRHFKW